MSKIFCTECGAELEESMQFCSKCGNKLDDKEETNSNISSSKKSYKNHIVIGYILAILGTILPSLAIFGAVVGIYLIYKSYDELISGKFNKTNVNVLLIIIFSILAIISLFNVGFVLFEIITIIIFNRVLETNSLGDYNFHTISKEKLIIVAVILILALVGSLWLSGTFSSSSTSDGSPKYVAGGQTTVFGKTFTIPEGFEESNRYGTSTFETVDFKNDKGASFEIHVSSDNQFPVSKYVKLQRDKTINGFDGQILYYQPANTERFVYFDNDGLLVYVAPETYPPEEIYDIVVC
ncbi:zinc ribbon domain-containing protein [uncultured Methanobrevibacter sp.]|uniref:zinc ribbon domain-containing protein n=1 Tax=uncultured Methanobrevibacter sp. TaxID=253161 RepID=UPI0025F2C8AD|nr:zinc ribbon domain-containing protein [uncultured Methanobrevibacter sp.]